MPTVRTDIPSKSSVSVSDTTNYGNGPSASDLLNPSRFADMGIDHRSAEIAVLDFLIAVLHASRSHCSDFLESRSKQEISDVFASIGQALDDTEFENIWNQVRILTVVVYR